MTLAKILTLAFVAVTIILLSYDCCAPVTF
jgi:hypothetical protein